MEQGEFVIRPVTAADFDWLYQVTHLAGPGLTSLPKDKDYIARRIDIVEKSFNEILPIEERIYLFLRQNLADGERIGLCGIHDDVGYHEAFYNYQISTVTQLSKEQNIFVEHRLLNIVNNFQDASELISFWIDHKYRGQHLSKSLLLARFLFMAQFPDWFGNEVIAEIRGVSDKDGNSPFWDAVGKHFFEMDFRTADVLTMTKGKQYISDLISREPIYLDLLPPAAQAVVGVAHPNSELARRFLENEGFRYNNYIDIFDAGPLLNVERDKIKTIANSKIANLGKCAKKLDSELYAVLYNTRADARITIGKIHFMDSGDIAITDTTAKILELGLRDQIRYCLI